MTKPSTTTMSFTICCNACGMTRTIETGHFARTGDIEFEVRDSGGYQPQVDEINMWCENPTCQNHVSMRYA